MNTPTPIQAQYIEAIEAYWKDHSIGPTQIDLARAMNRLQCTVTSMLETLENKNFIHSRRGLMRNIHTTRMQIQITVGSWPKEE